jgi:hypothetical protein
MNLQLHNFYPNFAKNYLVMGSLVNCEICGKEEKVGPSRVKSYRTCSHECSSIRRKRETGSNCVCDQCKIPFHKKLSQIKRYNRNMGIFCSQKCNTEYKKAYYLGENNPNFRGAQYDSSGYRVNHYPKKGRMKEHIYVAITYLEIDKIPKDHIVHHRDCNIYNNVPENLAVLTQSDHRWLHKQFGNATLWAYAQGKIDLETLISWSNGPERAARLLPLNLVNQSGVFKQGELLENPITVGEDNQQPNLDRNIFEGSTTNSRVLTSNVEDSNADTSALPKV